MFFHCKCGHWWKAHDSSNSWVAAMCQECRTRSIKELGLRTPPRRPIRAFSDDNPRTRYTNEAWVKDLVNKMAKAS